MLSRVGLEALDRRLASLARIEGALRLRLGQALQALGQPDVCGSAPYEELGFPALSTYVRERVERSARWGEAARTLARRLEKLPRIRGAVARGVLSWSMAEHIARIATPEDEADWLARAERMTVRQMQGAVRAELARRGGGEAADGARKRAEELVTLTLKVDQEDVWIWQATQALMELALDTLGPDEQAGALLGEISSTLANALPSSAIDWAALSEDVPAWRDPRAAAYRQLRAQWQAEAEDRCEPRVAESIRVRAPAAVDDAVARLVAMGSVTQEGLALESLPPRALDREVREVARRLAAQDVELARGLLQLHQANGWRRLGYASEAQYARERLGISVSLIHARQALARKLQRLPAIAAALERGEVGIEAAVAIVKVATPSTELEWLDRATRRTLKHLTEETGAAGLAARVSGVLDCPPPTHAELDGMQALERAVVSGKVLSGEAVVLSTTSEPARLAWRGALASLEAWLAGGLQTSAAARRLGPELRSAGRVEVTLRMSPANYALWHALEREVRRVLHINMSFLKFMCLCFWEEWRHVLRGASEVMIRDRARCTSPVCSRRDVQAHHLVFRSAGGGDEPTNLTGLCFHCHLRGIHEGRLTAESLDGRIRWLIGRVPLLIVEGRERLAA